MIKKTLKAVCLSLCLCLVSISSQADSAVEKLSPELRALLAKEMKALQQGMQSIIPAYASGNFDEVAHIARQMKNSFILKQAITKEQKQELKHKLPKAFIKRDQQFHQYAGMLAHVAEEKHTELVGFYFYKLTESCVGCHEAFATHKFPKLKSKAQHHKHNH